MTDSGNIVIAAQCPLTNTIVHFLQMICEQKVGAVVSKLKTLRKIEPYKGKGVREKGQHILKKEGKKK